MKYLNKFDEQTNEKFSLFKKKDNSPIYDEYFSKIGKYVNDDISFIKSIADVVLAYKSSYDTHHTSSLTYTRRMQKYFKHDYDINISGFIGGFKNDNYKALCKIIDFNIHTRDFVYEYLKKYNIPTNIVFCNDGSIYSGYNIIIHTDFDKIWLDITYIFDTNKCTVRINFESKMFNEDMIDEIESLCKKYNSTSDFSVISNDKLVVDFKR